MITWTCKSFDSLTPHELYAILALRNEVFIVEQNCPYQDVDQKDQPSYHLMGWKDGVLVAYTRLLPPGLAYLQPSIGRVVSAPSARGTGIGRELMKESIDQCIALFGDQPIRIGAQLYLREFYISFGFHQTSDIYLEDGIRHIEMIRDPAS
jgi:ElaA protein